MTKGTESSTFPIAGDFPVKLLVRYAEGFIDTRGVASRFAMVFEVEDTKSESWFIMVSRRLTCRPLFRLLPMSLRVSMRIPSPEEEQELERGTVTQLFEKMAARGNRFWFVANLDFHGAALCFRGAASDPQLARVIKFNRPSKRPIFKMKEFAMVRRDKTENGQDKPRTQIAISLSLASPHGLRRFLKRRRARR